jgi:hypothetical protein
MAKNKQGKVDQDAIKIFDKIYQKYEYVFKELAKNEQNRSHLE